MSKSESEKIAEVEDLFSFIMRIQDKIAPEVATVQEATLGQGRKGILMIRGEEHWVKVFEVDDGRLIPRDSVDGARTVIVFEGVDAFQEVFKDLLSGNLTSFSKAKARGLVRVEGVYAVRDLMIFNRLFSTLGRVLSGYGVRVGGG